MESISLAARRGIGYAPLSSIEAYIPLRHIHAGTFAMRNVLMEFVDQIIDMALNDCFLLHQSFIRESIG